MWEYWQRCLGVLTREQLERLREKTVAVAGVGGVGGLLAERLARTGIGELRIGDPDAFQPSDMNRQFGCTSVTLGRKKAEVLAEELDRVAPATRISALADRVSEENVRGFLDGADLVACEIHAEAFVDIVAVCEEARRIGIPAIATALFNGFGAAMCTFSPSGPEPRLLLEYLHWRQMGAAFEPPPRPSSTSAACAVAAGIGSAEITMYLSGIRPLQVMMPQVLLVDPRRYKMEIINMGPCIDRCEALFDACLSEN